MRDVVILLSFALALPAFAQAPDDDVLARSLPESAHDPATDGARHHEDPSVAALGLVKKTDVLAVVAVPTGPAAADFERALGDALKAAGRVEVAFTSRELGALDDTSADALLARAKDAGASEVLAVRAVPSLGARAALLQHISRHGQVHSRSSTLFHPHPGSGHISRVTRTPSGTAAALDDPLAIFERRAIRMVRTEHHKSIRHGAWSSWSQEITKTSYRFLDGTGHRLDPEEAMSQVGEEGLATRLAITDVAEVIELPAVLFLTLAPCVLGAMALAPLAFLLPPDPTLGPEGPFLFATLFGLVGSLGGLLAGLLVLPVWASFHQIVDVKGTEVANAVIDHNLELAREVGLDPKDVPPQYLGE